MILDHFGISYDLLTYYISTNNTSPRVNYNKQRNYTNLSTNSNINQKNTIILQLSFPFLYFFSSSNNPFFQSKIKMSSSLNFLSSNSLRFPILASPCLYTHKRNSSPTFLPSHLPCSIFNISLSYLHHSYQIASNFVLHTTIDNFANSHFFTFS